MYDEKVFKKSANKKAMYMWLFTAIILSLAYTIELIKGDRTPMYYTVFMIVCWVPFILGVVFLMLKGMDTTWYKETISVGYGVFYVFTVFTSDTNLTFAYIFPVICILMLYKDKALFIRVSILNIGLIIQPNLYTSFGLILIETAISASLSTSVAATSIILRIMPISCCPRAS